MPPSSPDNNRGSAKYHLFNFQSEMISLEIPLDVVASNCVAGAQSNYLGYCGFSVLGRKGRVECRRVVSDESGNPQTQGQVSNEWKPMEQNIDISSDFEYRYTRKFRVAYSESHS